MSWLPIRSRIGNDRLQYIVAVHGFLLNGNNGSFFVLQWLVILAATKRAFSARNQTYNVVQLKARRGTVGFIRAHCPRRWLLFDFQDISLDPRQAFLVANPVHG